jgi:hypothetical protein
MGLTNRTRRTRIDIARRDVASALFCVFFLAVMIGVPLWQLRVPYTTREIGRFAWQMYAHDHVQPTFEAIGADGGASVVRSRYRWRTWWGDFGFREALVRDLCAQAEGAKRIVATKPYMPHFHEDFVCP